MTAFRDRWRDLLQRVSAGEDVGGPRATSFLAGSPPAQLKLAERFYGLAHVRDMARLDESEVQSLLSPWLADAVLHAFESFDGSSRRRFLQELCGTEYVTISDLHHGGRLLDRFPGDHGVAYDDLYERTASGYSRGARLRVFKSTGEPLTPTEARSARASVRAELVDGLYFDGDFGHWRIEFEPADALRVVTAVIQDTDPPTASGRRAPW